MFSYSGGREALLGARAALRRLDLAVLRRSVRHERIEQARSRLGDLGNGTVEGICIGL